MRPARIREPIPKRPKVLLHPYIEMAMIERDERPQPT